MEKDSAEKKVKGKGKGKDRELFLQNEWESYYYREKCQILS